MRCTALVRVMRLFFCIDWLDLVRVSPAHFVHVYKTSVSWYCSTMTWSASEDEYRDTCEILNVFLLVLLLLFSAWENHLSCLSLFIIFPLVDLTVTWNNWSYNLMTECVLHHELNELYTDLYEATSPANDSVITRDRHLQIRRVQWLLLISGPSGRVRTQETHEGHALLAARACAEVWWWWWWWSSNSWCHSAHSCWHPQDTEDTPSAFITLPAGLGVTWVMDTLATIQETQKEKEMNGY